VEKAIRMKQKCKANCKHT